MTAIEAISETNAPASLITGSQSCTSRVLATMQRWWAAYLTWRLEQAAIAQLSALSDRELKDMGIYRSGIEAAVRGDAPWPHLRRYY
jgi:uncharacterized protein YjiS (DUF1127 family)